MKTTLPTVLFTLGCWECDEGWLEMPLCCSCSISRATSTWRSTSDCLRYWRRMPWEWHWTALETKAPGSTFSPSTNSDLRETTWVLQQGPISPSVVMREQNGWCSSGSSISDTSSLWERASRSRCHSHWLQQPFGCLSLPFYTESQVCDSASTTIGQLFWGFHFCGSPCCFPELLRLLCSREGPCWAVSPAMSGHSLSAWGLVNTHLGGPSTQTPPVMYIKSCLRVSCGVVARCSGVIYPQTPVYYYGVHT